MSTAGRPTLYCRDYCDLARNYCLLGATNEHLACFFEVTSRTVDNWIATHPEFAAAVKEGRAIADARVARGLYDRAVGYDHKVERTVWHYRPGAHGQRHRSPAGRHPRLHLLAAQPPAAALERQARGAGRRHG